MRVTVAPFLKDIAAAGRLQAEHRQLQFVAEPIDAEFAVSADSQLLASAVTNLLNNAYKFTRAGGRIVLRARAEDRRLLIEVEDECGGIPESQGDPFKSFAERRGGDRTGLGLGLSIARKVVKAHGGEVYVRNVPGKGCVFTVDMPLAAEEAAVAPRQSSA
jgi:signal transduction histidine kinase